MTTSFLKNSFLTITLLAMLFSLTFAALAQTTDSVFAKGNQSYMQGKYQQAMGEYLRIVKQGKVSSELYYNLGNSYFKINQNALAILYYEKALKLNPAHADARFNLRQANSKSDSISGWLTDPSGSPFLVTRGVSPLQSLLLVPLWRYLQP